MQVEQRYLVALPIDSSYSVVSSCGTHPRISRTVCHQRAGTGEASIAKLGGFQHKVKRARVVFVDQV